jgi:hypothetical protein
LCFCPGQPGLGSSYLHSPCSWDDRCSPPCPAFIVRWGLWISFLASNFYPPTWTSRVARIAGMSHLAQCKSSPVLTFGLSLVLNCDQLCQKCPCIYPWCAQVLISLVVHLGLHVHSFHRYQNTFPEFFFVMVFLFVCMRILAGELKFLSFLRQGLSLQPRLASLKLSLTVLLPLPPKGWDSRHASSHRL